MTEGRFLFSAFMTTYVISAVLMFEEPDLCRDIGEKYVDYTNQVPALFPLPLRGCFCPTQKRKTLIKKQQQPADGKKVKSE